MKERIRDMIRKMPISIRAGLFWVLIVGAVALISETGIYLGLGSETKWNLVIVSMGLLFSVTFITADICKEHYESEEIK